MLQRIFGTSLFALALLVAPAAAQDVYVVHGINGTDLGLDEELRVDIEVNGACALEDVPFTTVAGPIAFDSGDTRITIRLSDNIPMSCTGTLVLDQVINLATFETAVVVAKLDQNGAISLGKYSVDTGALAVGESRVTVAHAAVAPPVNVGLRRTDGPGAKRLRDLRNGEAGFPVLAPSGTYDVRVKAPFISGPPALFNDVPVDGNVVVVAAGSVANGTFTLIPVAIAP